MARRGSGSQPADRLTYGFNVFNVFSLSESKNSPNITNGPLEPHNP